MTKYRIVKFYKDVLDWYRLEKERETMFRGFEWVNVFESPSLERCEEYLNELREVTPPTVIKEYEF